MGPVLCRGHTTAILARLDRGYATSWIRTSENTYSTTLVNKETEITHLGDVLSAPCLLPFAQMLRWGVWEKEEVADMRRIGLAATEAVSGRSGR